ncbi:MAG TPA: response regulator [Terriglobales bacterium]|jgi:DNA-binding NarL/FixJ family response regulator|nr:response regulator [Terriglobales bacterium]
MSSVEILIADDREPFRRMVRSLVESQPDYHICGEAGDGVEAIERVRQLRPDIVLMDINMPRMNGLEATRVIRSEAPECNVIIVTQNDVTVAREQARSANAKGFVTKSDLARDLLPTIEKFRSAKPEAHEANIAHKAESSNGRVAVENNSSLHQTKSAADHAEPWCGLLNSAAARDHIVQLYQDQQFLNRAVCRFAAAAITNGEGVILVPTVAHWDAFRPRLEREGVDVKAAEKRGQLTVVDADNLLPTFMRDGMPDSPVFLGLAQNVISHARGNGRYPKVRWWGEMVNLLWERGDVAASMQLEDQFDQLAHEQDIAIFCSFLMDNFDGDVHARMLPRLSENHSHLIPVEDYSRLERAVSEALRDAVGPDDSSVLEGQLLSRFAAPFQMPRSQALLLALRQTLPAVADDVLKRSRTLYRATA